MTFAEYLVLERDEMLRYKWLESEKAGRDLGQEALLRWAEEHGPAFMRHIESTRPLDFRRSGRRPRPTPI
mgnify:CR=1 FL=1